MNPFRDRPQGAFPNPDGTTLFRTWAPMATRVELVPEGRAAMDMAGDADGFFELTAPLPPGTRYFYRLDGREFPDPASRHQPDGVHERSAVAATDFAWSDAAWKGIPLRELVFYELHVGTFTREGTFDAVIPRLAGLRELGVTMIELMPVAQFPGDRNWGYDGVLPFAVQNSYGGPDGLRRLVDAAHREGLAICLDVVYNHLGPEGNYLGFFGPYLTERYSTPWGGAMNFDGPWSDVVREYFIGNAEMWIEQYHFDALRLDAVHAIVDESAYPFLQELADRIHELGSRLQREVLVIPESDLNDPRLVRDRSAGGFGLDAHWSDDFHHALHALLTGERSGYYGDFGRLEDLAEAISHGYVYAGRFSDHRKRRHGADAGDLDGSKLVVAAQNHDQIGNRMNGERLAALIGFEPLKLAAATLLLSPFLPLLFMGEEYAENAPFLYFVSHGDPDLVESVRQGRRREFASFTWQGTPPDPQSVETFQRSKLDRSLLGSDGHRELLELHRFLLRLRREVPALGAGKAGHTEASIVGDQALLARRRHGASEAILIANFSDRPLETSVAEPNGRWSRVVDTAAREWRGPGETAPAVLEGSSAVAISLPPQALTAWVKESSD